jgi:hypothetical protein
VEHRRHFRQLLLLLWPSVHRDQPQRRELFPGFTTVAPQFLLLNYVFCSPILFCMKLAWSSLKPATLECRMFFRSYYLVPVQTGALTRRGSPVLQGDAHAEAADAAGLPVLLLLGVELVGRARLRQRDHGARVPGVTGLKVMYCLKRSARFARY